MGFVSVKKLRGPDAARRSDRARKGWETRRTQAEARRQCEEKAGVPYDVFLKEISEGTGLCRKVVDDILVGVFKATI